MADSLSNSIALTRGGLEIQIDERRRKQAELDDEFERIQLDISLARAESLQIDSKFKQLEAEIGRHQAIVDRADQQLVSVHERRMRLDDSVAELDRTLTRTLGSSGSDATTPDGIRPQAMISQSEVSRGILENKVEVQDRIYQTSVLADSLRQLKSQTELSIEKLRIRSRSEAQLERAQLGRKLAALRLDRDRKLPQQRQSLELEIRERQTQLAALSPIERVGSISSSAAPVRPRKKRAILILAFLGVVGGLTLAYTWDYVSANRDEIFRS